MSFNSTIKGNELLVILLTFQFRKLGHLLDCLLKLPDFLIFAQEFLLQLGQFLLRVHLFPEQCRRRGEFGQDVVVVGLEFVSLLQLLMVITRHTHRKIVVPSLIISCRRSKVTQGNVQVYVLNLSRAMLYATGALNVALYNFHLLLPVAVPVSHFRFATDVVVGEVAEEEDSSAKARGLLEIAALAVWPIPAKINACEFFFAHKTLR